jgi:mono/diheme cytochrome c family protein
MFSKKVHLQTALLVVYVLSSGGIILLAQDSKMREVGRRDWSNSMPDGEGKGLILGSCAQCHSLNSTVQQRKSPAAWERTVLDMITRGAQVRPDEVAPITTYLARYFGPGAPPLSAGNEKPATPRVAPFRQNRSVTSANLPEGMGKELVLSGCIGCHALNKITEQSKDEAGWRSSVKDMVRLGARLRPEEQTRVVVYLVKYFGPQTPLTTGNSTNGSGAQSSTMSETARASGPPADLSRQLPDGEGKGLILASCVQCHNLRSVVGQRKDAEDWRRTVHDMVERGAQVTGEEAEIISRYLAAQLSKVKK